MIVQRITRAIVGFGVALSAYFVYAVVAGPIIEPPEVEWRNPSTPSSATRPRPNRAVQDRLIGLFPPDSWEMTGSPKVLENERVMLVVQDYRTLSDDRVELKPCSIVLLPKEQTDDSQPAGAPIVMRAPQGAILKFDERFDLRKAKLGNLVGGELVGEITINSVGTAEGAKDDLRIVARDATLEGDRLTSPHPVTFRLGKNSGGGRQMQIKFATGEAGKRRSAKIGGMQWFELGEEVRLTAIVNGDFLPREGGQASRATARSTKSADESQVQVTCKGPFRFDMSELKATFSDQVDVMRLGGDGPADQLVCELLTIHFSRIRRSGESSERAATSLDGLEPRLLEASGNPVIVEMPSESARIRCQRLEYEISSKRITLDGTDGVSLRQGENEIHARRRLDYQPSSTKGGIGRLLASGAGWLQGSPKDDPSQKYFIRWASECRIRPHLENQVISLVGGAQMRSSKFGSISADELHIWLTESPAVENTRRPSGVVRTVAFHQTESTPRDNLDIDLNIDRMLANGSVVVDSPRIVGQVGRLEVWFDRAPSASSGAEAEKRRDAFADAFTKPVKSGSQSRYQIGGGLMRVQAAMRGGKAEVRDVSLEGGADLRELAPPAPTVNGVPAAPEANQLLLVQGDSLHVEQADRDDARVNVSGKTATIEARGMTLAGAKIQMDRKTNRAWIDGPGKMTLPDVGTLDGGAIGGGAAAGERAPAPGGAPKTLDVTWQTGMDFDGKTAVFDRSVVAKGASQLVETDKMEVRLNRRIDFGQMSTKAQGRDRPEVEEIACLGAAALEDRVYDKSGRLVSAETLYTRDLTVNKLTGEVTARGPGWLETTRRGSADGVFAPPPKPGAPAKPVDPAKEDQLSYLHVRYDRSIGGNILPGKRSLTFAGNVKTVYGRVADWEQKLDYDDPDKVGPGGMTLSADQITVRVMPVPGVKDRNSAELETLGNTIGDGQDLEGNSFSVRAHQMTYDQAKDLLVIRGEGRGYAKLYRQSHTDREVSTLSAQTIMFMRTQNQVKAEGIEPGAVSDFGNLKKR